MYRIWLLKIPFIIFSHFKLNECFKAFVEELLLLDDLVPELADEFDDDILVRIFGSMLAAAFSRVFEADVDF